MIKPLVSAIFSARLLHVLAALLLVYGLPLFAACQPARDEIWQFSVPVPAAPGRQAVLWVPPQCHRVRAVVVALQNMLEKPLFENPAFRHALAENDLAAVLIYPGRDTASPLDLLLNPGFKWGASTPAEEKPAEAGRQLQAVLSALALESGYPEIRYAPLIPFGHSSAGPFLWHIFRWDASRIVALVPLKTGLNNALNGPGPQGIPIFNIESEWFDYGKATKRLWAAPGDNAETLLRVRAHGDASLFGFYTDIGSGHCAVSNDSIPLLALFLKEVVALRVPDNAPLDAPVSLKPVSPRNGWLIGIRALGQPGTHAYPYADFPGNPLEAFWYPGRELAEAVQHHLETQLAKKPQQLNFVGPGGHAAATGGTYYFTPEFIDDAGTFRLHAEFLDRLDSETDLFTPETRLGHAPGPICYRVGSGALVQVGPDTFRIVPHFGPLRPQGNPWEPTIIAYHPGNADYQPTDRPAHANVRIVLTDGAPQSIEFPSIPDKRLDRLDPIKLHATASSGLPVQYFMVTGPARIEGDTLVFDEIPSRARYPVKVVVAAWQWGRPVPPKIRTADIVTCELLIRR